MDASIPKDPKVAWSASLPGRGLSSPIVIGEKVFVTASAGPDQQQLQVLLKGILGDQLPHTQVRCNGFGKSFFKEIFEKPCLL